MDPNIITVDSDAPCPVILIPKSCTSLESEFDANENVFLDLNITTADIDGNPTCIYSGVCNVKLIDSYNVHTQHIPVDKGYFIENHQPIIIPENQDPSTSYNQSEVWIDPERSPNVYNNYEYGSESQENYSIHTHTQTSHITVEKQQSHTYITQKVYNFEESIKYCPVEEYEHKKFKKILWNEPQTTQNINYLDLNTLNLYEDDEIQCGVFLSQLPEEIMNETENRLREERKFVKSQSQNDALKQLMSPNIQASAKQTKTILFLGHDASHGQTLQKIKVNDPSMECIGSGDFDEILFFAGDEDSNQKKYQCVKCKQIFDQLSLFKQHMSVNHHSQSPRDYQTKKKIDRLEKSEFLSCSYCDKFLKTQKKLEQHLKAHGDPDLECDRCGRVFASKATLRNHRKLHFRKHRCNICPRSFSKMQELRSHAARAHSVIFCNKCNLCFGQRDDFTNHMQTHVNFEKYNDDNILTDFTDSLTDLSDVDLIIPIPIDDLVPLCEDHDDLEERYNRSNFLARQHDDETMKNEVENANSVINTVMANEIFRLHSKKAKNYKRSEKICEVCLKHFDRIGDLKRHLIEHVVRSTLAKSPVNDSGILNIQCEVCRVETFTKIDKYKAHLREHAKLTLYKCTFCDKSFSDSSNFSKHKKVHGDSYLQCDLCHRKFHSKRMIEVHMEHHKNNKPFECNYCDKLFYFKSMLYKHLRGTHNKEVSSRFRCKFCNGYYKSLKEKWDHEWLVHSVRKTIVDCQICGSKFRKYSELKKHCWNEHSTIIPSAKKMLRNK